MPAHLSPFFFRVGPAGRFVSLFAAPPPPLCELSLISALSAAPTLLRIWYLGVSPTSLDQFKSSAFFRVFEFHFQVHQNVVSA